MTRINLEYFGMPGSGATVKEAKLDAGKRIESALNGSYSPTLLVYRGEMAVISRDITGWGYRLFTVANLTDGATNAGHCSSGFATEAEVMQACRTHMAHNGHVHGETECSLLATVNERRAFERWAREDDAFQSAYRASIASGASQAEAHQSACAVNLFTEVK